jgi:hypothetical protein
LDSAKNSGHWRLDAQARQLEFFAEGPSLEAHISRERALSSEYDGRSVFGWEKDAQPVKLTNGTDKRQDNESA